MVNYAYKVPNKLNKLHIKMGNKNWKIKIKSYEQFRKK